MANLLETRIVPVDSHRDHKHGTDAPEFDELLEVIGIKSEVVRGLSGEEELGLWFECWQSLDHWEKAMIKYQAHMAVTLCDLYQRFPRLKDRLKSINARQGVAVARVALFTMIAKDPAHLMEKKFELLADTMKGEWYFLWDWRRIVRPHLQNAKTDDEILDGYEAAMPDLIKWGLEYRQKHFPNGPRRGTFYDTESYKSKLFDSNGTYSTLSSSSVRNGYQKLTKGGIAGSFPTRYSQTFLQNILEDGHSFVKVIIEDSSLFHHQEVLTDHERELCGLWFTCLTNFLKHALRLLKQPELLPETVSTANFKDAMKDIVPTLEAYYRLIATIPNIESNVFQTFREQSGNYGMTSSSLWHRALCNDNTSTVLNQQHTTAQTRGSVYQLPPAATEIVKRFEREHSQLKAKVDSKLATTNEISTIQQRATDLPLSLSGEVILRSYRRLSKPEGDSAKVSTPNFQLRQGGGLGSSRGDIETIDDTTNWMHNLEELDEEVTMPRAQWLTVTDNPRASARNLMDAGI